MKKKMKRMKIIKETLTTTAAGIMCLYTVRAE